MSASIHAKVAASVVGSVLAGVGFAIAEEAGGHPSAALISSVTAFVTFAVGWLVPATILDRMTTAASDDQPTQTLPTQQIPAA